MKLQPGNQEIPGKPDDIYSTYSRKIFEALGTENFKALLHECNKLSFVCVGHTFQMKLSEGSG